MRKINEIIIHCSATKEGKDFDVSDIDRWHKKRGFLGCGYHYVIKLDGTIQEARSIAKVGAHCKGHNLNSIGICYIGGLDKNGCPKDTRTVEQFHSLFNLVYNLRKKFGNIPVYGHNKFANKACPCFDTSIFNFKL